MLMLLAILLLLKGLIVFALARYMRHNVADSLKASGSLLIFIDT